MSYERQRDGKAYFSIGTCSAGEHFHRSVEIICEIEGEKVIFIDGREYRMQPGDLLLVPPLASHRFPFKEGVVGLCAVFPVTWSDVFLKETGGRIPQAPVFRDKDLFEDVRKHLLLLRGHPSELMKEGIYAYVLARLIDAAILDDTKQKTDGDFVVQVLGYLEEHYPEKLTLETVSAVLGYNRCYFSTLFRKNMRMGFCSYLTRLRISHARPLLGKEPIAVLCRRVGYDSPQAFYTAFRRVTGQSPAEYLAERDGKEKD